jgi:glycerol uptake facilitator-like aquaporin
MNLSKRTIAEFFGTFWLVFCGCGGAVVAAAFPTLGIGFLGVALPSPKSGSMSVVAILRRMEIEATQLPGQRHVHQMLQSGVRTLDC